MSTAVHALFQPDTLAGAEAEASRLFDGQRETALQLRLSTAEERIGKLARLRAAVEAHRDDIHAALKTDLHRPDVEADLADLLVILQEASLAMRKLKGWMQPKRVSGSLMMTGTFSHLHYEPMGRCLIISPWNFPLNLSLIPLIHAVAAGNTAIIKPSEFTPASNAVLRRIVESVFDEQEVAVMEGEVEASQALLALPFDHIFFTGSPAVGKIVMAAAARHLGKVTLELGGKSPVIVDRSANLRKAARSIANGKHQNAGQICIAPDYVFVHEDVHDEFVAELRAAVSSFVGDSADMQRRSEDYSRIISERHAQRLQDLLTDAVDHGAAVAYGGETEPSARYVQPTALTDVPQDARIMQEEIFGPLLPVLRYREIGDVIDHINDNPKPLALYVYASDDAVIEQVLRSTSSGNACVNAALAHFAQHNLPFGGVNNSGLGSSHGYHGFRAFSHERGVLRDRFAMLSLFFPPYTPWVKRLMKLAIRYFG